MKIEANGTEIFYERHLGGSAVVLLHGWGGSHDSMRGLFDCLSRAGCDVINLDLPGFGKSPPPPSCYGIEDYTLAVREVIEKLELKDVTLVGHSFGGRISILLAAENKDSLIKRIVLASAAGIKPKFSWKRRRKIRAYKRAVKKGLDVSGYGSSDYKALGDGMRQIFVRVVNRHLDDDVKKIRVPTLLIWGKNDAETPLYMAKKLHKSVKDSGLVLLDGGHFAYAEQNIKFNSIVKNFINS